MSGIVGSRFNIKGSGLVGSLGTDGQIFTSSGTGTGAVFEDAAAGGAWTLIKTQTISTTTSTMDFVDGTSDVVFDGTYKYYKCYWRNCTVDTTAAKFYCQVKSGGSFQTSGYLAFENQGKYNGSSQVHTNDATTASMISTACVYTPGAEYSFLGEVMFEDPTNTATRKSCYFQTMVPFDNASNIRPFTGAGAYETAGAITGFRFLLSTGDFETLEASLYGLATS